MRRFHFLLAPALFGGLLIQTPSVIHAQAERPGIDRPIRVGMFKGGTPDGRFWHSNTHTAHAVMAGILANPAAANLGDSLVLPPAGFTFYSGQVAQNNAGTEECSGNGCKSTSGQITDFVSALDTLDVVILHNTGFPEIVTDPGDRQAFADFWATRGYVGIHEIANTFGEWAPLDTINGAVFRGHPAEQDGALRRDSVFSGEPQWQFLNRGLFSNGTDTTIFEEWFYFTESGSEIRSRSDLKPTLVLDESSLANSNQQPMGDHPMSWYRNLPTGGRMFYTGLGHRSQVWETTRTFRRQLYNAILWAAKYDSISTVSIHNAGRHDATSGWNTFDIHARTMITAGHLTVSILGNGAHTVELLTLDGRRVETRNGLGGMEHDFAGLPTGVYLVTVATPGDQHTQRVMIP